MTHSIVRAGTLACAIIAASAGAAFAGNPFDGTWSISIATTKGPCDQYNFPVQISHGAISFPGLVKAEGVVANNGAVRVNIAAMDKSANGSGRLSLGSGSGRWNGKSGDQKCSGTWSAAAELTRRTLGRKSSKPA